MWIYIFEQLFWPLFFDLHITMVNLWIQFQKQVGTVIFWHTIGHNWKILVPRNSKYFLQIIYDTFLNCLSFIIVIVRVLWECFKFVITSEVSLIVAIICVFVPGQNCVCNLSKIRMYMKPLRVMQIMKCRYWYMVTRAWALHRGQDANIQCHKTFF